MIFSVTVLRFVDGMTRGLAADVVMRQQAKGATSIGANYRAACSARSRRDFTSKLAIVVEEAEESVYWLAAIRREAVKLRAIFARSLGTARLNALSRQDRGHAKP